MLVDLVQTTTRDGLRLDGSYQPPAASARGALGLDALCMVHGTGSNFYGSTLFDELAASLVQEDCAVLRINTRGHDSMSTAARSGGGGLLLGAAFEVVDECRHDLAAWLGWLRQHAGPRVGLLGHSLGAVKCLYAVAHEPALAPACVVALSPPRLSYAAFCASAQGPEFLETIGKAQRLLDSGQGSTLLSVRLPLPMLISAAGYVEKYGPDERYNFVRFINGVSCPTLVVLGGQEVQNNMAFRGVPEDLAGAVRKEHCQTRVLPGGDHFYTGMRGQLTAQVVDWLRGTVVGSGR